MTATDIPQILIVDDSPPNILILAGMLEGQCEATFATSGPQALALIDKGHRPDLILLDVMMPQMDGYTVCSKLKGDPATRDIPVIFVTARSDAESESRALSSGGVDFIHKPVNEAVLRARVGLHLELKRQSKALTAANAELARHRDHLDELVHARTRELAEARDGAEGANRAKTAFLANMSHELRTPIGQIAGLAHLLARNLCDDQGRERVSKMQQATRHLLALIDDILLYSKTESDEIRIESMELSLAQLLERAESTIRQSAAAKGLHTVRELDPALPAWLKGDPLRLQQILGHLLSNAVKFSERGTIHLRARLLTRHNGTVSLRFEVEDQGIGIEPDMRDTLFQLFNQGDNSIARKYGGTGLGLAMSKRLVSLMAGEIGVESTPGQGSLFWFVVRLGVGEAPAHGAAEHGPLDWAELSSIASQMDGLLASADADALALWTLSRDRLAPLFHDRLDPFESAVQRLDFQVALTLLREAVAASPEF